MSSSMDHISAQLVRMTAGRHSQLHNPTAAVGFVEQLQNAIQKSAAPRRNFLLDTTLPHGDVVVTEASAMKPSTGWITVQVTEGIRRGVHEWCINIENQGETTDGSGLMLGLVPRSFCKHDSFISQGGGWCMSRAGKFYGHWRRQDPNAPNLLFGTGDRVIFTLDYDAARMTVRVGDRTIVGEMSNLTTEVFPAASLHYRHQHIRFEYHKTHDREARSMSWMQRNTFPAAAACLPFVPAQLQRLPLDSYLFSSIFAECVAERHDGERHLRRSMGWQSASYSAEGAGEAVVVPYASREAILARLWVLASALATVHRYAVAAPARQHFLSPEESAACLRRGRWRAASQRSSSGGVLRARGGYDAALSCGAMVVVQLFVQATKSGLNAMALPLLDSLKTYLLALPLYALANSSVGVESQMDPEVMRLAVERVAELIVDSPSEQAGAGAGEPRTASRELVPHLLELLVLMALQRGSVGEVMLACRLLLQHPSGVASAPLVTWLQQHASGLLVQPAVPDIAAALTTICDEPERLAPSAVDTATPVLAVGYGLECFFIVTADCLSRWGSNGVQHVCQARTNEPGGLLSGVTRSSLAVTSTTVVLLTDRMLPAGVAVVTYDVKLLQLQRIWRVEEMDASWPQDAQAHMQLTSAPHDQLMLLYESHGGDAPAQRTAAAAEGPAAAPSSVMLQRFALSTFPRVASSGVLRDGHAGGVDFSHCLALRRPSHVDLGSPESLLSAAGGHVTVELWIQLQGKEETTTFYRHGDKATSGEVFLETARLDGALFVRGGYRHNVRGSSEVSSPLPPTAEATFTHIALVFDGRWHLFFDGREVAVGRRGPHVSLSAPKQRWTLGNNTACLLAGLRVWSLGRAAREVARDYQLALSGAEPGLVAQLFFHERGGNVVTNFLSRDKSAACHAICVGSFARVPCDRHPWKPMDSSGRRDVEGEAAQQQARTPMHNWRDLTNTRCCTSSPSLLILSAAVGEADPFSMKGGRVLLFFDVTTCVALPAAFYLTDRSSARAFMGSDPHGRLWELFDMDAAVMVNGGALGEPTAASNTLQRTVVSLARLPLTQRDYDAEEGVDASQLDPAEDSAPVLSPPMSLLDRHHNALRASEGTASASHDTSRTTTFEALAVWLLQLLSQHTEEVPSDIEGLFTPLSDDVGRRCVMEIILMLKEHFRSIKRSNARRAVFLTSPHSPVALTAALQVLLRLLRRVRDYALHPASVGLGVLGANHKEEDLLAVVRELYVSTSRYRGASVSGSPLAHAGTPPSPHRPPGSPSRDSLYAAGGFDRDGGETLLSLLGDVINEAGVSLPAQLGTLARTVLMEGIELFIPSARARARLLREVLAPPPPQPLGRVSSSLAPLVNRVPALSVLMDAIVHSLSSVTAAALIISEDAVKDGAPGQLHTSSAAPPPSTAVQTLLSTAKTLLDESLVQLQQDHPRLPPSTEVPSMSEPIRLSESHVAGKHDERERIRVLASLADAIGALQMLLLSAGPALRWDYTQSDANQLAVLSLSSRPARHDAVVREYFEVLFTAARRGLQAVFTPSSPRGLPSEQGGGTSGWGTAAAAPVEVPPEQSARVESSFLGTPLHTALTAIPLLLSIEDAPWFLDQLQQLLQDDVFTHRVSQTSSPPPSASTTGAGEQAASPGASSRASRGDIIEAIYEAAQFASTWTAWLMARCTSAPGTDNGDNTEGSPAAKGELRLVEPEGRDSGSAASRDLRAETRALCNSEFLAGGLPSAAAGRLPAGAPEVSSARRDVVLHRWRSLLDEWVATQGRFDNLSSRVPRALADVIALMAATALYLCNIPRLQCLTSAHFADLMTDTMARLIPVRNALLDRFTGSTQRAGLPAAMEELQQRCMLLLSATSAHDATVLGDDLYCPPRASEEQHSTDRRALSRWKRAIQLTRRALLLRRADVVTNAALNLPAAIEFVSAVVRSDASSAAMLQMLTAEREGLARLRLQGLQRLLSLLRADARNAASVALLNSGLPVDKRRVSSEGGLNGCPAALCAQLRESQRDMLLWFTAYHKQQHGVSRRASDASEQPSPASLAASPPLLSAVMPQACTPRAFRRLWHAGIVPSLFRAHVSLFVSNTDGSGGRGSGRSGSGVVWRLPLPWAERRHRDEVREGEVQRGGHGASPPSPSSPTREGGAGTLRSTAREQEVREVLLALKELGVNVGRALQPGLPCAQAEACAQFLSGMLDVVQEELLRCSALAQKTKHAQLMHVWPALGDGAEETEREALERVCDQINLLTSLTGVIARGVSVSACLPHTLCLSAVSLAHTLLTCMTISVERPDGDHDDNRCCRIERVGCVRTAALLLQRSFPTTANATFVNCKSPGAVDAADGEASTPTSATTSAGATVRFLFDLAVDVIITQGQSDLAVHTLYALRDLLRQPRWASELAALHAVFQSDLECFAKDDGGTTHDRVRPASRMYVWMSALGAAIPHPPARGLPVRFPAEDTAVLRGGYVVDIATSDAGETAAVVVPVNRDGAGSRTDDDVKKIVQSHSSGGATTTMTTASGSNNIITDAALHTPAAVLLEDEKLIDEDTLLSSLDVEGHCPTPYEDLIPAFVAPALRHYSARLASTPWLDAELASLVGLLDLCEQLTKHRPPDTASLLREGSLRVLNQLAIYITARLPLPVEYLKEYAAYVMQGVFRRRPSDSSRPPSTKRWTKDGFALLARSNLPAMQTTLCLPCNATGDLHACLTIVPNDDSAASASGRSGAKPLLSGARGLTVELVVQPCTRYVAPLGGEFAIPSESWSPPVLTLHLLSIFADQPTPLLQVSLIAGEIICTLQLASDSSEVAGRVPLSVSPRDGLLHVAAVLEESQLVVATGVDVLQIPLEPTMTARLQSLLASDVTVTRIEVGNPDDGVVGSTEGDAIAMEEDCGIVLVRMLRVVGTTATPAQLQGIASSVSKEQHPTWYDPTLAACCFFFNDVHGDVVYSTDGAFRGTLRGAACAVGWPLLQRSPLLDRIDRLPTDKSTRTSRLLPRREVTAFLNNNLDEAALEIFGGDVLWTLAAYTTRAAVAEALRQALSPSFCLYGDAGAAASRTQVSRRSSSTSASAMSFHPLLVLEPAKPIKQVVNLFRYSSTATLSSDDTKLLSSIVSRLLLHLRSSGTPGALAACFEEAQSIALFSLREEDESFKLLLPLAGGGHRASTISLLPLTLVNGGAGSLLFDPPSRGVEHVTVFKDRLLKNALQKYPDGQGGWPVCMIPPEPEWCFIRASASPARTPVDGAPAPLLSTTITTKSMRLPIMCVVAEEMMIALRQEAFACGRPHFFNAQLLATLVARSTDTLNSTEGCVLAVSFLTSVLRAWTDLPAVQPHDRCPLHVVLAPLNTALMDLLRNEATHQESAALVAPATGVYGTYAQSLLGLLISAIHLGGAWAACSYRDCVRSRWSRLHALWRASTHLAGVSVLSCSAAVDEEDEESASDETHLPVAIKPIPATPSASVAASTINRKGSGEWFVRADEDALTVRSSIGITHGRFYFEVRVVHQYLGGFLTVGVMTDQAGLTTGDEVLGHNSESWGFDGARLCRTHPGYTNDFNSLTRWKPGDVIGIRIDLELDQLSCTHNGRQVSMFDHFTHTVNGLRHIRKESACVRAFYPAVSMSMWTCDINLGAAPFAARLADGFLPIDITHYSNVVATQVWQWVVAEEVAAESARSLVKNDAVADKPSSPAGAAAVISHPAMASVQRHVAAYNRYRRGPLVVGLISSAARTKLGLQEVVTEGTPCVVKGSVSVSLGRWYYEVLVRGDAALSIGWVVSSVEKDWSGGPGGGSPSGLHLGDDAHSWALEGKRMIAKHNGHQISLIRHSWRGGEVVGCLLDADAGTIGYTINGIELREVHDVAGGNVLFKNVMSVDGKPVEGLTPAVRMDIRSAATFLWSAEDMLYLPEGYQPIGASTAVMRAAMREYFLRKRVLPGPLFSLSSQPSSASSSPPAVTAAADTTSSAARWTTLERVVRLVSDTSDLNPNSLHAFCLSPSLGCAPVKAPAEGTQATAPPSIPGVPQEEVHASVAALYGLAALIEVLYPWAYEDTTAAGYCPLPVRSNPMLSALRELQRYALPFVGLSVLHHVLLMTSGDAGRESNENLKLILNRRKAFEVCQQVDGRHTTSLTERLRGSLFGQIYHLLSTRGPRPFTANKATLWSVSFFGEGAHDVGGPYRESLSQLFAELMSRDLPLFLPSPNQAEELGDSREAYVLHPQPPNPPVELAMYRFIGRLIGGCLRAAEPLSVYFPSRLWKAMVGAPADVSDLFLTDCSTVRAMEYVRQLVAEGTKEPAATAALDEELGELCPGCFTVQDDAGMEHELVCGGRDIPVDHTNAELYVNLVLHFKLHVMAAAPLAALIHGFHEVVPQSAVAMLKWYELEALVCGRRDYDPEKLIDAAELEDGLRADDSRVAYLRQVLREFTRHQRALFMRFVSGRERLPQGMRLRLKPETTASDGGGLPATPASFNRGALSDDGATASPQGSVELSAEDQRLPRASTCFYWLSLPRYSSAAVLREKLLFAIEQCMDIDGDFRVQDRDVARRDEEEPTIARVDQTDDDQFEDYTHLLR